MSQLAVEQLSIDFGGLRAIDKLSFEIAPGTIHSIIGPNGAGKTTLFNLITGIYTPSEGRILLDGEEVTGLPPHRLARRGMCRTFQNLQIFERMSAVENVMLGRHLHESKNLLSHLLRLPGVVAENRRSRAKALELLELVGLGAQADAPAGALPYGALKRLEIARALAGEPKMLLLDEPAAGCNAVETQEIDAVIQTVAGQGVTVVLVEHDMHLVMNISSHILVLDYGRKLAEGTAEEVRANPDVIAAYLGQQAEEATAHG
ncbi:high-affinity branched-chain amino acid ABC transporter ATP-binding protein LivG [Leptolyngbya valderiana BDU 20041]|nr:high-affinity branched-chain amino acid ABC transporter ATP-binding protein LivG [Leptolyngbya valderiana BDU 20041]